MSGQQEPRGERDRLDPRDSTLDMSSLISRLNNGSFSNGNRSLGNGGPDDGVIVGDNALTGNSGVNGIGDTVPYVRPPHRAQAEAEPDVAQPPALPPVTAVSGAHEAVTIRPEPSGANGRGALAAYGGYAPQGTHTAPRHLRETAPTATRATTPALPDVAPKPAAVAAPDVVPLPEVAPAPEVVPAPDVVAEPDAVGPGPPPREPSAPAVLVTSEARPERPVPGSLADLRQRLERLPYGHPSSPYHVDGERKPPPYRLKHLELAPPTPSRISHAHIQPAIVEDDPIATVTTPSTTATATTPSTPATASAPSAAASESPSPRPANLTEDQVRIANDAYDRFRAAEGRNLFGSYGSTGLTTTLREVAASLEYGELAPDTDQHALLEPDAFKARFAAMLAHYPDRSAELLARRIPGAISYSFIFDADRYSSGIWMAQDALTATGFQLLARRNDWNNAANRCVATMWHDPTSGLPFEVQFHTTASVEAQQLARSSAALISDPRVPSAEAADLRADLAAAWSALPAPPGLGQIGDYRWEGGQPPTGGQPPAGGSPADPTANG